MPTKGKKEMIPQVTSAYIFSKLGSSSSLLPMLTKDVAHSAGMTTSSYLMGDKVEGKDRFMDEAGAAAIWIGGLPFFKELIDKTVYKIAGHDAKIDVRVLKDKKIIKKAIENAPTEAISGMIEKAQKSSKMFKGLFLGKFIAATAFTLGSYGAFTIFRHKHTEKTLIKEIKQEQALQKAKQELESKQNPKFPAFEKNNKGKKPSFGMNLSSLKAFMFDPVKNMQIIDGGITAERLGESRNPQDLMGYVIKEGSFWFFMYFAQHKIQEFLENNAEKKKGTSIDLNIKVLQDKKLLNFLKNDKLSHHIQEFKKYKTDEELYDFICQNKTNYVVNAAKASEEVKMLKEGKNSIKVDTRSFIDLEKVKKIADKLEKLEKNFNIAKENGKTPQEFLKETLKLKRLSVIKGIGISMGVLGFVVPGMMIAARLMDKENKGFQVKKQVEEKMKQNMLA